MLIQITVYTSSGMLRMHGPAVQTCIITTDFLRKHNAHARTKTRTHAR